jgi:hypothetical protein
MESNDALNPIDENSQSSSSSNNGTIVVEFTVANLNTNAVNCTVINRELQCIPFHNNATNKFRIRLHPDWAPIGVNRFMYLRSFAQNSLNYFTLDANIRMKKMGS